MSLVGEGLGRVPRDRCGDSGTADGVAVAAPCRAAGVSISAYEQWRRNQDAEPSAAQQAGEELLSEIGRVHASCGGTYGCPRVHTQLRQDGWMVNHTRVERYMPIDDIVGVSAR